MRSFKTADGNSFFISDGKVSDTRGNVVEAFLTKVPKIKLGESVKIHYCYKDCNGEFPRDEAGILVPRILVTAPVVA